MGTVTDLEWIPSLRDPVGQVYLKEGRLLRVVTAEGLQALDRAMNDEGLHPFWEDHRIVPTRRLRAGEIPGRPVTDATRLGPRVEAWFEHEFLDPISYPWEWPQEMLHAAGVLTLDLAKAVLNSGLQLKDATPLNCVFQGPKPTFVDVLSFEAASARCPYWPAYGQFVRMFLLPLLISQRRGMSTHTLFLAHRNGISPHEAKAYLPWKDRMGFIGIKHIGIPTFFESTDQDIQQTKDLPEDQARFIKRRILAGLTQNFNRLAPGRTQSTWSTYQTQCPSYEKDQMEMKRQWVLDKLESISPKRVLDAGANEGDFSLMAAHLGARTVSVDSDPAVVGRLWRRALAEGVNITPLVIDLSDPTPGRGWMSGEQLSFIARLGGWADASLWLAVMHHLQVSCGIPLLEVVRLAKALTKGHILFELIGDSDPMYLRLAKARPGGEFQSNPAIFESITSGLGLTLRSSCRIPGSERWLYHLETGTT